MKKNFIYNGVILSLHFLITIMTFQNNIDIMLGYALPANIMSFTFVVVTIIINVVFFLLFILDPYGRVVRDFIMVELFIISLTLFLKYAGVISFSESFTSISLNLLFTVFILIHPFISIPTMIANLADSELIIWGGYTILLVIIGILRIIYAKYLYRK